MNKLYILKRLLAILSFVWSGNAIFAQTYNEPFWNHSLPLSIRINDLLSRLTVEEKISFLIESSPGVPRLGIPKYYMGNEALHGVVRPGKFTVFPQAIGLASTWNSELIYRIATAISDEARGRWNELEKGKFQNDLYSDLLVFWSPNINLARDPRWGRTQETYGEDPFLTSQLAVSFIKGLQGNDKNYLKVVATPKHFTANNEEHNRFYCNAILSERSLREYYLVPFEYAVKEGKAQSIMTAYNAINGIPCTVNKKLLYDILRKEWGFDGFVVSDCGAIGFVVSEHKYLSSEELAAAASINAGVDLECAGYCGHNCFVYKNFLKNALNSGIVSEAQIDSAVYRVLKSRFRLGFFDPNTKDNPYNFIPPSVVGSKEHQRLALEAARQSIVLLKNDRQILPLDKTKIKSIALFGPMASICEFGDYSAKESANEPVSVLKALEDKLRGKVKINYIPWKDKTKIDFPIISKEYFRPEKYMGQGLSAEYFSNRNLKGKPKRRIDNNIDFNPSQQAPDPWVISGEKSIRWTGILTPDRTGKYQLVFIYDGGVRFYFDDRLILDSWAIHYDARDTIEVDMRVGREYKIRIEYFANNEKSKMQLRWKVPETNIEDIYSYEKKIASESDYVIAVLGLNTQIEKEGQDRSDLNLPKNQEELIMQLYNANPNTIVVLETGSPLSISWINDHIPAVLNAWYPGEQGGNAIVDVLFGDYNPAGRLPITFYKSTEDLLPFNDYEIMKGRTYMYLNNKPLYPFGYGLSYSEFKYSDLSLSASEINSGDSLCVFVNVTNVGPYDGEEVVQLYVKNKTSKEIQPIKMLKGFQRVSIRKGETKKVKILLKTEDLRYYSEKNNSFIVEKGVYEVQVGASSEDIRLKSEMRIQ